MRPRKVGAVLAIGVVIFAAGTFFGLYTYYKKNGFFMTLRAVAVRHGWTEPYRVRNVMSQSPAFSDITALPYVEGSYDPRHQNRGVVLSLPGVSADGYNFYSTLTSWDAYLVDMAGHLVWRWSVREAVPHRTDYEDSHPFLKWVLLRDGGVIAGLQNWGLIRLDRGSHLIWVYRDYVHHYFWVDDAGTIYALVHHAEAAPEIDPGNTVLACDLLKISPAGKLERRVSLLKLIENSPYRFLLPRLRGTPHVDNIDGENVFHANSVEVFDGSRATISPLFAKGNILLSLRNLNAILIVNPQVDKVLWLWGPTNLTFQHDPSLTLAGTILVFNNGRKTSRVVEVDPRSDQVVWSYMPGGNFFSSTMGGAQRLPNGNTLITEANAGYAMEVTRAGRIVWEYANPEVTPDGLRRAIPRMVRYQKDDLPFLNSKVKSLP